jgi:hypothetical protein
VEAGAVGGLDLLDAARRGVGAGVPSMSAGVQVDGPPAGSVEVTTWAFVSRATHSDTDGHAIELRHRPSSIVALCQLPAAGLVELASAAAWPTATHREADGQAMLSRSPPTGACFHTARLGSAVVKT